MNTAGVLSYRVYCLLLLFLCAGLAPPVLAQYQNFNRYAVFNGSSYISVPFHSTLNATLSSANEESFDAWVYPTSFANSPVIIGNDIVMGYGVGLSTAGKIRFTSGYGYVNESAGAVPLNQWTHIAVTYRYPPGEIRFYINGVLNSTATGSSLPLGTSTADLRIGADRSSGSPSNYFNGRIDEVRIWKKAIDFSTAEGLLWRVPHAYGGGLYGRYLVSAWRLNGDATDSVRSNHGSAVGTVTYSGTNAPSFYTRISASLKNDGSGGLDYISIPSTAGLSPAGSYSLEAWVYPTSGGASTQYQTIACKGTAVSASTFIYWLGINKSNGKLRFAPNGNWAGAMESSTIVQLNQWTHVAATFAVVGGTRTAELYFNGLPMGSATYGSSAAQNALPLLVGVADGTYTASTAYAFSGRIDELRVWSAARSAEEIANAHRLEIDGPASGLEADYHFNGDVLDASGNGTHGTVLNPNAFSMTFVDATSLPAFPVLSVTTPNGGEAWTAGETRSIAWNSSGIGAVRIELSRDGGSTYTEIVRASAPASAGSYSWPVSGPQTSAARVRVATSTPTGLADESNANFTIAAAPTLTVLAPNGGESFAIGSNIPIAWASSGVATVRIELSRDGGSTFPEVLHASVPAAGGTAGWTVSAPVTSAARIRIISVSPAGFADTSDANFSITPLPSVTVLAPNGGESWISGSQRAIVWSSVGVDFVRIDLSRDAGATYTEAIAASVPALAGMYSWFVTDPPSTSSKIRVQAVSNPLISDASDGMFAILAGAGFPVAGRVISNGNGVGDVTITVQGDTAISARTSYDGNFVAGTLRGGSYTITPSSRWYSFQPDKITLNPLNASRTDLLFVASPLPGSATIHYTAGWNLISLPLIPGSGSSVSAIFHDAAPAVAYRYDADTGYIAETELAFGRGYWIRCSKSDSVRINGVLQPIAVFPVSGASGGWNLIGSLSGDASILSCAQLPGNLLVSAYQFDPGSAAGYHLPPGDLLRPGRGYFVKVRGSGTLGFGASFTGTGILPDSALPPSTLPDILFKPPPPPGR